jgi:DNA-binding LytR/AlgR family response regulator
MVVDTCVTTDVKVRIATGKLNKIKSLTDEEGIQIHRNLVENLKKLSIEIDLERLPF